MDYKARYYEKLKDPRWQKKRLQILERDKWRCHNCQSTTETLNVHHLWYERGAEPWEAPPESLITLCEACHQFETEERPSAEQELLFTLRQQGFLTHDVEILANVIDREWIDKMREHENAEMDEWEKNHNG